MIVMLLLDVANGVLLSVGVKLPLLFTGAEGVLLCGSKVAVACAEEGCAADRVAI